MKIRLRFSPMTAQGVGKSQPTINEAVIPERSQCGKHR
jgi:hypothetical protein